MSEDCISIYDPEFTNAFRDMYNEENSSIHEQHLIVMEVLGEFFEDQEDPPTYHMIFEDGELSLEWSMERKRLGFALENDIKESSWFVVSKDPMYMDSGTFTDLNDLSEKAKEAVLTFRRI
ncbi:MAG: hypothetical protein AAGM67_13385 [Bacteroidota bacterium]